MARWSFLGPFARGNFTYYFSGQVIANTGVWFQNLALSLVILEVTGSAQALSGVTVAQFLPILLLSVPAGWVADRIRPRSILLATSLTSAALVTVLAFVVGQAELNLIVVYGLIAGLGVVNTFERIAAQTLIFELVGPAELGRAASLSTIAFAAARSVGPGLAGIAFQALGPTACLLVTAGALVLVFVSVVLIRPSRLFARTAPDRSAQKKGSDKPRLMQNRDVVTLLVVNTVVAVLAFNLMLVLTSMVTLTFEADATALGAAHALNALGGIAGGLLAASRVRANVRGLVVGCLVFGVSLALTAVAPTLAIFLMLGPLLGLGAGYYQGVLQAAAQESVPPHLIGRMMSRMTLGHYGVMPFGALLMGWVIDHSDARVALLLGATGAVSSAVFVLLRTRRRGKPNSR